MSTFKEKMEEAYSVGPDNISNHVQFMAGARAALEIAAEQLEKAAGRYVGEPNADESIAREACGYALTLRRMAKELGE